LPFSEKVSAMVGFGEVLQHTPLACALTNELLVMIPPLSAELDVIAKTGTVVRSESSLKERS
jgi:hypothetical protein